MFENVEGIAVTKICFYVFSNAYIANQYWLSIVPLKNKTQSLFWCTLIFMNEGSNTSLITTKLANALYLKGKVQLTTVLKACDKATQAESCIHHEVILWDQQRKTHNLKFLNSLKVCASKEDAKSKCSLWRNWWDMLRLGLFIKFRLSTFNTLSSTDLTIKWYKLFILGNYSRGLIEKCCWLDFWPWPWLITWNNNHFYRILLE